MFDGLAETQSCVVFYISYGPYDYIAFTFY